MVNKVDGFSKINDGSSATLLGGNQASSLVNINEQLLPQHS